MTQAQGNPEAIPESRAKPASDGRIQGSAAAARLQAKKGTAIAQWSSGQSRERKQGSRESGSQ